MAKRKTIVGPLTGRLYDAKTRKLVKAMAEARPTLDLPDHGDWAVAWRVRSEADRVGASNRRKEIVTAAAKGVREYLQTMRGANACGPNARVDVNRDGYRFVVICSKDNVAIEFTTYEM